MTCAACGVENRAGRKFCSSCGAPLARACPSCGAANEPDDRFCGECGTALEADAAPPSLPQAERRLVSVLFGDLVGFTPLSENRDPEEVRDLLSRYFETSRRVVDRYGGTIEKFIGDAVMAVWGTPVAREDDAERAVRAGLELVEVVAALGSEVGAENLAMRVGIVTGEAAVTVGAEGQGMVAGDLVNTASRVQSAADAGTVLVGERTRRASEAAIAYADAGEHTLKGKSEPVPLWRAERVTAYRGGEGRAAGLESPFVGRESEFRLVKDLFHATSDERRARLVSIVGIAGIGKTRLSWELEKYIDGLAGDVYWHRGRCLAYGEGVAYWALAEMVRSRAGITEQEEPETAAGKLRDALEEYVSDPDERTWVEQRLAQLLGVAEQEAFPREDLFAAWRLFFERLAEQNPTVLLFEDLQWADPALLDFVDYLLDWSRGHPLFVVTLARPELAEKQPGWGGTKRDFTSLTLEPLGDAEMERLLAGLVPGLPEEVRARIRDRAEGVPLYAVETVRMLLDRGLLQPDGDGYVAAGDLGSLEVPETLHALIAARLDDLDPSERRVIDDAAVLGKTFTVPGLAALTGTPEAELEPLLASLVRKDLLTVQSDPRSPERGNYGFLQALVQRIAHDTLSRKEQKARHLAAARYLEESWGAEETEIVEVIAAHYLDAYRAEPGANDAAELRTSARDALARAGRRAFSLGAHEQAQRYFEQAAELADEPELEAELLEQAGVSADADRRGAEAIALLERAIALWQEAGLTHPAARGEARLAMACFNYGQVDEATERMGRSFEVLSADEPDADLAMLAGQLARYRFLLGDLDGVDEPLEYAIDVAEALILPDVLSDALNSKGMLVAQRGRREEGLGILRHGLDVALEHDQAEAIFRGYFNLSFLLAGRDRWADATAADEAGIELARRRGNRIWEESFNSHLRGNGFILGEWDAADLPVEELEGTDWDALLWSLRLDYAGAAVVLNVERGRLETARAIMEHVPGEERAETQERGTIALGRAALARGEGRPEDALRFALEAASLGGTIGNFHPIFKQALAAALDAAVALDEPSRPGEVFERIRGLSPGVRTPLVDAQLARYAAHCAAAAGDLGDADRRFRNASELLREVGASFYLAVVLLEHGALLATERPDEAEPLLAEARETFERLGAAPWLDRLARLQSEHTFA
ncbi:MAG TPA: adenylate/guanylate cyclase domain-containing protein [Gaiellaceae bacterium]|nr:adenylate/guanylate cyclase domain-containing protein [Gaiellaceae bacterium]